MSKSEVVGFVRSNRLRAVMMWWNHLYTPEFDQSLREAGAVTYVHSLDAWQQIEPFRSKGVGVYSNGTYFPPF